MCREGRYIWCMAVSEMDAVSCTTIWGVLLVVGRSCSWLEVRVELADGGAGEVRPSAWRNGLGKFRIWLKYEPLTVFTTRQENSYKAQIYLVRQASPVADGRVMRYAGLTCVYLQDVHSHRGLARITDVPTVRRYHSTYSIATLLHCSSNMRRSLNDLNPFSPRRRSCPGINIIKSSVMQTLSQTT